MVKGESENRLLLSNNTHKKVSNSFLPLINKSNTNFEN